MSMMVFMFVCAIIFTVMGLWHYTNSEDTAFHKWINLCKTCEADVKRLEGKVADFEAKVKLQDEKLAEAERQLKAFNEQLDIFRDQVGETRERQIQLKDDLSNKTSRILLPKGPIPVEIYVAPTARATKQPTQQAPPAPKIPKETPQQQMKKIKKQIDGLSK